jgi:hypothetical protein
MFGGRKYGALIRSPLYPPVLLALRLALCVLLAALLVLGDVTTALIVAVFLALSFAHLLRSERRPTVFDVLFALAALAAALGFVFDLFSEVVPYDELTHAFTTFSVSLAFYFLFYAGAAPYQEGRRAWYLGVHAGRHRRRVLGDLRVVLRGQVHSGRHDQRPARGQCRRPGGRARSAGAPPTRGSSYYVAYMWPNLREHALPHCWVNKSVRRAARGTSMADKSHRAALATS